MPKRIDVTVIACFYSEFQLVILLRDPARQRERLIPTTPYRAEKLAEKLSLSPAWQLTPSLSRGRWKAVKNSLLEKFIFRC